MCIRDRLLPVTDRAMDYAKNVAAQLDSQGFRVEVDGRNEKIGKKIRAVSYTHLDVYKRQDLHHALGPVLGQLLQPLAHARRQYDCLHMDLPFFYRDLTF